MAIRAQPLKPVFQRMHRIIREAADATGKQVRLVTVGETTEVDKTVIERLVDPLTHMIRNSVDPRSRRRRRPRGQWPSPRPGRSPCRPHTAPAGSSSRFPTTAPESTAKECAASRKTKGAGRTRDRVDRGRDRQSPVHARFFPRKTEGIGAFRPGRRSRCGATRDPGAWRARHDPIGGWRGHNLHHRPAPNPRRSRRHARRVRWRE